MINLIKSISNNEWKFWAKVLLALLIFTSLVRVFAVFYLPKTEIWTGRNYFAPSDRYVYVSYVEQARQGAIFFDDLYAYKDESAPMLNVFWLGLGKIAEIFKVSANFILEFSRLLLIPILLFILYLFLSFLIKNILQRKITFLLACFAGGLGAYFYPLIAPFVQGRQIVDNLPIDLVFAESFVFTSSYYSSHYIFSLTLFVAIFLFIFLGLQNKKLSYGIYAGLCGLILANFHPFSFVANCFVLGVYLVFLFIKNKQQFFWLLKILTVFSIISLPSILYHIKMFNTPWWQNQAWNSNTEIPNLIFIITGYGMLLVLAFLQIIKWIKNNKKVHKIYFLICWAIGQFALIFLPISVQRRFLEGYSIILSILAGYFIYEFVKKRHWIIKGKFFAIIVFIFLFSASFLCVIFLDFQSIYTKINPIVVKKPYFESIEKIKDFASPDDIILADIYSSNIIPGINLRRIFAGHGVETINFEYKHKQFINFAKSASQKERKEFVENYKIDYFFYDPDWNWTFNPEEDDFLKKVYENGGYKIYKIKSKN